MTILTAVVFGACHQSTPVAPSSTPRTQPLSLKIDCVEQLTLRCSASVYAQGDATAAARWSAADSFREAADVPQPHSSAVEFTAPGVVRVLRRQNIYIRADYTLSDSGSTIRNIAPHAYAVTPSEPPERLAYVTGFTYADSIGGRLLGGVTLDITSGEGAGIHVATREDNASYMIEFLHLNVPFTIRATKSCYSPDVRSHPGIADDALGYPSNNFLHFALVAK